MALIPETALIPKSAMVVSCVELLNRLQMAAENNTSAREEDQTDLIMEGSATSSSGPKQQAGKQLTITVNADELMVASPPFDDGVAPHHKAVSSDSHGEEETQCGATRTDQDMNTAESLLPSENERDGDAGSRTPSQPKFANNLRTSLRSSLHSPSGLSARLNGSADGPARNISRGLSCPACELPVSPGVPPLNYGICESHAHTTPSEQGGDDGDGNADDGDDGDDDDDKGSRDSFWSHHRPKHDDTYERMLGVSTTPQDASFSEGEWTDNSRHAQMIPEGSSSPRTNMLRTKAALGILSPGDYVPTIEGTTSFSHPNAASDGISRKQSMHSFTYNPKEWVDHEGKAWEIPRNDQTQGTRSNNTAANNNRPSIERSKQRITRGPYAHRPTQTSAACESAATTESDGEVSQDVGFRVEIRGKKRNLVIELPDEGEKVGAHEVEAQRAEKKKQRVAIVSAVLDVFV